MSVTQNSRIQNMTRSELIAELEAAHSREFILMFLGYLCAEVKVLRNYTVPQLLGIFETFEKIMAAEAKR